MVKASTWESNPVMLTVPQHEASQHTHHHRLNFPSHIYLPCSTSKCGVNNSRGGSVDARASDAGSCSTRGHAHLSLVYHDAGIRVSDEEGRPIQIHPVGER